MKKLLFLISILSISIWGCKEASITPEVLEEQMEGGDHEHHEDFVIEWLDSVEERKTEKQDARNSNPHGLAVGIHSPYPGLSETHANWSPPAHHTPWYGDWATDVWKDNGNAYTDYAWSCDYDVRIDAKSITYPGGNAPQSMKARLMSHGYACGSQNFQDGGLAQKWEIIGTYGGVDYPLGWVLYAHLAYVEYTAVNTVIQLNGPKKIAKSFWNTYSSACSGSCHIHMEFYNYKNYSCFDIMEPAVQIDRVGIVGGLSSGGHCPDISNGPQLLTPVNCANSSRYNWAHSCHKAYDNNTGTKWVSNGSSPQSSLLLDLGSQKNVSKIVVKHASSGGEPTYYNIKHFKVEYGNGSIWGPWSFVGFGNNWQQTGHTTLNTNFNARYIHLYIINAGVDNYARIPEVQVYGN